MLTLPEMVRAPMGGAGPWWDPGKEDLCIWAAYQPKGSADLASSYIDLSGNGNNCGPGVAPTWDVVNGWKFNGTTQYLVTTFIPTNDQSQSCIVQFTDLSTLGTRFIWGTYNTSTTVFAQIAGYNSNSVRYYNGAYTTVAPQLTSGNLAVAGAQGYRNGAADGGAIGVGGAGVYVKTVWIGCLNLNDAPSGLCGVYIQALAIYDCTLTAPQVLAVATAMAAL